MRRVLYIIAVIMLIASAIADVGPRLSQLFSDVKERRRKFKDEQQEADKGADTHTTTQKTEEMVWNSSTNSFEPKKI